MCVCGGGQWREYESPLPTLGILLKLPKARLLLPLLLWHSSHLIVRRKGHGPVVRGGRQALLVISRAPSPPSLILGG